MTKKEVYPHSKAAFVQNCKRNGVDFYFDACFNDFEYLMSKKWDLFEGVYNLDLAEFILKEAIPQEENTPSRDGGEYRNFLYQYYSYIKSQDGFSKRLSERLSELEKGKPIEEIANMYKGMLIDCIDNAITNVSFPEIKFKIPKQ